MPPRDEPLTIERSLWTNDAEVHERAVGDDAVLVFPETAVITRVAQRMLNIR